MDIPAKPLDLRVGIDIGGTFTDFVTYLPAGASVRSFKLPSTPGNPAAAVLDGLRLIAQSLEPASPVIVDIIHGSTVATNALLERKGARTALLTTRGFRDILQIGRQERPALYDFTVGPPAPLVPEEYRLEVDERLDKDGNVLVPLDIAGVEELAARLVSAGVESVAVCLLFSFANPEHERAVAGRLRGALQLSGVAREMLVSLSSEILPEYREYERTSTTVINAYVTPVLDRYLSLLERDVGPAWEAPGRPQIRLRAMQSNGGQISLSEARRAGVRCILSGPAGGITGARHIALRARWPDSATAPDKIITFDMGGTSTDVSLIDGEPQVTTESSLGGMPVAIPMLAIHTIGAGGGSIAAVDLGGALRVGPQSAGADPGPACYGRGALPTVTDANLVLGRLDPAHFLGGKLQIDPGRAVQVLSVLGRAAGLAAHEAALGVIEVVNAHMERALRLISVERGYDPADFTLLSFGGAGGLHAAALARRLGIPRLVIPPLAATLSAFGMLAADVVKDYSQTVMLPGSCEPAVLENRMAPIAEMARREVRLEGVADEKIFLEQFLDLRYRGQSYELTVPFQDHYLELFHQYHEKAYGFARPEADLEIVNIRVRATGLVEPPRLPGAGMAGRDPAAAYLGLRPLILKNGSEFSQVPAFRGEDLLPGNEIDGPALILRSDTTVLIGPGDHLRVDENGNLMLRIG